MIEPADTRTCNMGTHRSTTIHRYNVKTNNIGTVKVVDLTEWRNRQGDVLGHDGYSEYTFTYYRKLYFIPNNGVTLDGYTWHETTVNHYEHSYPDEPSRIEDSTFEGSTFTRDGKSPDICDGTDRTYEDSISHTGFVGMSIYIGEEYQKVTCYTDNSYNSGNHTFTTTFDYEFTGRENTISLKVFGAEEDCTSNLTCCKFGDRQVAVFGTTDNPHFYTNLVAFDAEYDPDSDSDLTGNWKLFCNFPSWFIYKKIGEDMYNVISGESYNNEMLSTSEVQTSRISDFYSCYRGACSTNVCILIGFSECSPRSVLLYADSHFATFFIGYAARTFADADEHFSLRRISAYAPSMTETPGFSVIGLPDASVNERYYNPDENLSDYDMSVQDDVERLNNDRQDYQNQLNDVLKNHRWTNLIQPSSSFYGEGYIDDTAFIRYIDRSDGGNERADNVLKKIKVKSQYARFTKYWRVQNHDNLDRVSYDFTNIPIGNCKMYPLFKPYASCTLVVKDSEPRKDNDPNAVKVFPDALPKFYIDKIVKNDCRKPEDYSENLYYQHYYMKNYSVDASHSQNEVRRVIQEYCKTISPFKWEIWQCHGGRDEYDETRFQQLKQSGSANIERMGQCNVCISSDMGMKSDMLRQYHKVNKFWNTGLCLGIHVQSCFGGGIQKGIQRNRLNNTLCKQASNLSDVSDLFYCIGSVATHVNYGNSDMSLEMFPMYHVYKPSQTYSEYATYYNNAVQSFRSKSLYDIRTFYTENFQLMLQLLPTDEDREMWNNTKETILYDLATGGYKYLCMYYWDWYKNQQGQLYPGSDYTASDCYFIPEEKKYHINEGFIKVIKLLLGSKNESQTEVFRPGAEAQEDTGQMYEYQANKTIYQNLERELLNRIKNHADECFGHRDWGWNTKILLTHPIVGCSGKFKTSSVKFGQNPNQEVAKYLNNDDDLKQMAQTSV